MTRRFVWAVATAAMLAATYRLTTHVYAVLFECYWEWMCWPFI